MNESAKPLILAIDDQPVILHAIVAELKDSYQTRAFTSGQAALKYLNEHTVDLIILDYEMPEMSGIEVLERIRAAEETSGIPVVFLTGSENGKTEVEVLEKGASDYIQKPIKAPVLRARVRMHLELARYRNSLEAMVREQTEHLQKANDQLKLREAVTLNLLAEATDMRDHDTGGHIGRVTDMVRIIVDDIVENPSEDYRLTREQAEDIIRSAKLHDIGKIAVPDEVLLKPARLNAEEFEIIMLHPGHGAGLLNKHIESLGDDSFLDTARDIAMSHHEKWNGMGYPHGIKEHEIPLSARITAIADVYDALTSARPYKEPFSHETAVKIISEDSGKHFDPVLVSIFLKHEKQFGDLSAHKDA